MLSKEGNSIRSRLLKLTGENLNMPDTISYFMAILGALIIFLMGFLVFFASVFRYFFNVPSGITLELTGYIMYFSTFLAAPWLLKIDKHVSVDILKEFVFHGKKLIAYKLIRDAISLMVCIAFLLFSSISTYQQFMSGIKMIGMIEVPRYIVSVIIPLSALFMVFVLLNRIRDYINNFRQPENRDKV